MLLASRTSLPRDLASNCRCRSWLQWTGIQLPAAARTLRLNYYCQGTMPDGSAGLVNFKTAARAEASVIEPIVLPR